MPTAEEKRRGVKKYRTIKLGNGKYKHVAIVKKAGPRGGHTVAGPTHKRKKGGSMKVRCKFLCTETGESKGWNTEHPILHRAKLIPVTGNSEENKKFFAATPSGEFNVGTISDKHFQVGEQYFIDITEAKEVGNDRTGDYAGEVSTIPVSSK